MSKATLSHEKSAAPRLPAVFDWRTSDADEIEKRRARARNESFEISNTDSRHPIYSNFQIRSRSGLTYAVEIRELNRRQFGCECVDFRINGLGTCKHIEAAILHLQARFRRLYKSAATAGSNRMDVIVDRQDDCLRLSCGQQTIPATVACWFGRDGAVASGGEEEALEALGRLSRAGCPNLRISQEVAGWLARRRHAAERKQLRHEYEQRVQRGEWPAQETKVPLFPYQRDGMLHLAFAERALLADEMGLGKTIQAIAASALLHRLEMARRVLVVTPASLKTEWEEQIQRFTSLPYQLVFGSRTARLLAYDRAPFFTIVNYEQILADGLDVNNRLRPDIVVLDEAQRIKNWGTKTAQAVKRLRSRYAFVLTGTPIENRIDDLHSLMDFLDPAVLGPLFRFNRDFYDLDDRGRPQGYRNLGQLNARIKPFMLRRRKADVETELPRRTDRTHFVTLTPGQRGEYEGHELQVSRLLHAAKRRMLTVQEQEKLQRELAMMRMTCDSNYILNPDDRACPKLGELEKILEECRENDAKAIIFSEWERMLELVRELCEKMGIGHAWHTGSVPQLRRRAEINTFKTDPNCRAFLSTDCGATGLNLQNASVVINCDLPWNPAKLEQRIARAWRKNQTRPVTVIHLVAEDTIEHRMLDTLATKQALADGVLDLKGDLDKVQFRGGKQAMLARLQQLITPGLPISDPAATAALPKPLPSDRAKAFAQQTNDRLGAALVLCEERYPQAGSHSVLLVVVDQNAALWRPQIESVHSSLFGPGKSDPLAPVLLEVIDRATHDALERLSAAGLIQRSVRSSRPLWPGAAAPPETLSDAEREKAATFQAKAARQIKLARMLGDGGFIAETIQPLKDALVSIGRVLAIEARMPEPADLDDALRPPLSQAWETMLEPARQFVSQPEPSWNVACQGAEAWIQARAGGRF